MESLRFLLGYIYLVGVSDLAAEEVVVIVVCNTVELESTVTTQGGAIAAAGVCILDSIGSLSASSSARRATLALATYFVSSQISVVCVTLVMETCSFLVCVPVASLRITFFSVSVAFLTRPEATREDFSALLVSSFLFSFMFLVFSIFFCFLFSFAFSFLFACLTCC